MSLSSRKLVARPVWWNQSGNSEAAKMKSASFEAAKKRAAVVQTAGPDGGAPDGDVVHF